MLYKNKNLYKTWVEISKENLLSNLNQFKKNTGGKIIACIVKANAYGHDLGKIVQILKKDKSIWFGVDSLSEAVQIRKKEKRTPILILGYIPLNYLETAIKNNFSFVVYNQETLERIIKLKNKKPAKVHLKIETGLNRQGVIGKDLLKLLNLIKQNPKKIILEGVSTHFADIEDTLKPDFAMEQLKNFNKAVDLVEKNGFQSLIKHCAATAATILYPQTHFNLARVGIGLYGLWPSRDVKIVANKRLNLKPVLTWKTVVAQIKKIKKGGSVSYGRTWFAQKDSKIAIIPVGYYDGLDRKLSNCGRVLIKGQYANIIGRVAMDMLVVEVAHLKDLKLEDEVVIIGKQGKNEITAEEMADKIGTINYEIVTRINPMIPRVVI